MSNPAWRARLLDNISDSLEGIRARFMNPEDVKITLVVRCPWLDDGDTVVSDDDYDKAIASIRHLQARESTLVQSAGSGEPAQAQGAEKCGLCGHREHGIGCLTFMAGPAAYCACVGLAGGRGNG